MLTRQDISQAETYVKKLLSDQLDPAIIYHDWRHTANVLEAARNLAAKEGLQEDQLRLLELAVLFHDTGFTVQAEDHETHSKNILTAYVKSHHLEAAILPQIHKIIESTRMGKEPEDHLSQIMCDADLSHLGTERFGPCNHRLREEWSALGHQFTDEGWRELNLNFLLGHKYYTRSAQEIYNPSKAEHLLKIQNQEAQLDGSSKKKKKKKKMAKKPATDVDAILDKKSAQMMFKTTMRNQIDLTAIADNKANIMLSINAIILSVALPILADDVNENSLLLFGIIPLTLTCLTTMFYATMVTRPIAMTGRSEISKEAQKNLNLFFFGNFFRMDYNKFKEGMLSIFEDNVVLDNAALMDLFYLGKSLGFKYSRLRICYTIFITGIIVTGIAFCGVYIYTAVTKG